jgi:hemerythrin-like metal-binding protein
MENMESKSPSNKIAHVVWESKFSVHAKEIDAQHRELFSMINRIADLYESGSSEVHSVLLDLVQYLLDHFRTENLVMFKTAYPEYSEHIRRHDQFIEEMQRFLKNDREKDERVTFKMLNYSRNWIYFHIITEDQKYAEHLVRMRMKDEVKC